MKAIGYARCSTLGQAQDGVTLAAQDAKIRAYCALNDIELTEIVVDAGKTAKNTDRDGLNRVLALVESGEVQAVVVLKLDRLSRRVVDTLNLIERIEAVGAAFHSIQEKVDTRTSVGRFFLAITAAFAQMERDQISERTATALAHLQADGKHVGSIPYGHKIEDGKLVASEVGATAIATILEWRAQGRTLQAIADELNDQGVASARGGKWFPGTVSNVCRRAS